MQPEFDQLTTFDLLMRGTSRESVLSAWKPQNRPGLSVARAGFQETFLTQHKAMSDWNGYVALNPSRGARKPSFDDVTEVEWMVLDLDPAQDPKPEFGVADVTAALEALDIKPAGWAFTGRGYQCWICLGSANVSIPFAARIIKGITKKVAAMVADNIIGRWRIDPSCAEITRIVRLPGTINHKTGILAEWLETPIPHPNRLSDLTAFAVPESAPAEPLTSFRMRELGPALEPVNLAFLMYGCDTNRDSRHRRLFALACNLFELGVPQNKAAGLLRVAASRCVPNLNSTDPEAVERIVAQKWRQ